MKVSHCPAAAMRMLGFAPIKEMIDAGVCVSLGTDGAPSNNRMSIGTLHSPLSSIVSKTFSISILFYKLYFVEKLSLRPTNFVTLNQVVPQI